MVLLTDKGVAPASSHHNVSVTQPVAGSSNQPICCYSIHGHADPGLMLRLLELFAKRGVVPSAVHAIQTPEAELVVDLQVSGLPVMTGELIAESMRQIPLVTQVFFAERIGSGFGAEAAA